MFANESNFPGGVPRQDILLAAYGFSTAEGDPVKSGGLKSPARTVEIPVGAALLRLFKDDGDFGPWWFTPHEYTRVCNYFGVSGEVLSNGREGGRSAFHGALVLLSEWYGQSAEQLSRFHAVRTVKPLRALFGHGDTAVTKGFGRTLKPLLLEDGESARQIFLPDAWTYRDAFDEMSGSGADTDANLHLMVAKLAGHKLPFE